MSNENKIEFKFIEHSDSLNKCLRPSSSPNFCPNFSKSIIKLWVQFEGNPDIMQFVLKEDDFNDMDEFNDVNLDGFKSVLHEYYPLLKSVENYDIELFNESFQFLNPATKLSSLNVVGRNSNTKIIVRYPLSSLSIKMNLKFVNNRSECRIKHTTGSFNMLQVEAKAKFESLADCKLSNIYFECKEEKIENTYHFTFLVENNQENGKKELSLDLKILVRNQKSFSDWKLEEVLRNIYDYENSVLELVTVDFNLEDLPQLSLPLSNGELDKIVDQLNDKKFVFDKVNANEATAQEFISVILVNVLLEKQRLGLGKRKIDQTDIEYNSMKTMPIISIITTERSWIFICHTYNKDGFRLLEMSSEFEVQFKEDNIRRNINVVVSYIVRPLLSQIRELEQQKSKSSYMD
ncbi:hypothetical protein C1645_740935 [Glomus cerebriforme]|uniref:Kinetochore complex Sim4 subunit Fta1-domain-containing protein n=1 Tax=Glomus cerebriforme TaxID=658196 RepID=A0A397STY2_9GLOM|nr:hypothetical protein C1645_740935 [Glomus cerebriforme]